MNSFQGLRFGVVVSFHSFGLPGPILLEGLAATIMSLWNLNTIYFQISQPSSASFPFNICRHALCILVGLRGSR